ncbi:uncharacterized protein Z520_10123 [Fonsecaea multimorphosa CBS 102226]|uniref:Myocyte-specific enhancer factor 2d n=1 Tax=Fonsecaea multimorphosa CBS 102226 TaxID=1442371 RepID=A0A0D2JLC6_9EURO|nr:uncharacterized protein Z520_10123 [Fonsecaea multimorphosa CBS 102226]KIX94097.1 hypothetical protein Z520_10123 [Fonsecaea multimorphosa CBS 102226]OAL19450.1 hypothetical protein AYO22_09612 [Fonsecaea multimorphosa]
MAAELPGYYFDPEKNRYFKIQANHIAPAESKYSRQAVKAEKVIKKAQRQDELLRQSKLTETVTRSKLLQHPLLVFDRRLGHLRKGTGALVSEYYAAGLKGNSAFSDHLPRGGRVPRRPPDTQSIPASGLFSIEETSGTLFADCWWRRTDDPDIYDTYMLACHPGSPLDVAEQDLQDSASWPVRRNHEKGALYKYSNAEEFNITYRTLAILAMGSGLVVWSEDRAVTSRASPFESVVRVGACRSGPFGDRHDMIHQASCAHMVRGLAAQPGEHTAALTTERGLLLMDLSHASYPLREYPMGTNEMMTATFKDRNTVMGGTRSGKMLLCDIRAPPPRNTSGRATATRLQHGDAVMGLAALPDGGNRILISGLRSMKIYDLRFTPPPTLVCHLPRSNSFKASPSVLTFNIPATHQSRRYGMSFCYDPELNIVLRSSTDDHKNHRAALWSATTGRLLPGPLNNHRFESPIDCAAMVRVRDGPKSIFISSDKLITEWTPQGRGAGDDQE